MNEGKSDETGFVENSVVFAANLPNLKKVVNNVENDNFNGFGDDELGEQ